MAAALYDPDFGYYTRNIRTVGRRGDFSTSATLSGSLARCIAHWLRQGMRETGIRNVIEIGAGDGSLAEGVLRSLGFVGRRRLRRYVIIDISEPLVEHQRKKLGHHREVEWADSMTQALDVTKGEALVFSNEAVDAFPANVFQWCDDRAHWRKLHLRYGGDSFTEFLDPMERSQLPDSSVFDFEWPDGQRVEVYGSYLRWLREWCGKLRAGRMLTIDYGDTMPALYARRPHGSLRGYFHQQRLEGTEALTQNIGKQDLTADVNFTDLQRWGEKLGLRTLSLQSQAEFLESAGVRDERLGDAFGAGTAFKVLSQEVAR